VRVLAPVLLVPVLCLRVLAGDIQEMDFKNAPAGKKWKLDDQWIDIQDDKGKVSGKMHLIVRWIPPGVALQRKPAAAPEAAA
jgi:hypothetical protein